MTTPSLSRPLDYSARDVILLAALGIVAGVLNTGLNQLWTPMRLTDWSLSGALAQGGFAWAYLVGFYLVRKPGCLLIVGVIESAIQILMGGPHGSQTIGWGLAQGLAAELILALTRYRHMNVLFFLVAGAAAAQLRTLWTALTGDGFATPALIQQYQLMIPFTLISGACLSGLLGFLIGAGIMRAGLIQAPTVEGSSTR